MQASNMERKSRQEAHFGLVIRNLNVCDTFLSCTSPSQGLQIQFNARAVMASAEQMSRAEIGKTQAQG